MSELNEPAHRRVARGDAERPESLCMAPWVGLHISATGAIKPCCEYDRALADANETSLPDYWNGSALAEVRERLARGVEDPGCWKCTERSRAGSTNLRDELNAGFSHHEDRVDQTLAGESPIGSPVHLDLRFSNLCNLRCRTCWHGASSRWHADAIRLSGAGIAGPNALIRSVDDPDRVLRFVRDHAEGLEQLYFAGGEPLIMEEHYALLLELDRRGLHDVELKYNTNFTETVFRGHDVFDLWARFRNVTVLASVDGLGARGELIRKDLSWKRLLENRRRLKEVCPSVEFGVNSVVSVLNVFHIAELQRTLHETGFVDLHRHEWSLAQEPPIYNIQILPRRMKRNAERILREHIRWLEEQPISDGPGPDAQIELFEAFIAFMKSKNPVSGRFRFADFTTRLDELRGEELTAVAPELAPLMRYQRLRRAIEPAWPVLGRLGRRLRALRPLRNP